MFVEHGMRSAGLSLEVAFAEAKARDRLDAPFARTCLRLLRQCASAHAQPELLESLADSLTELVFSREPRTPSVVPSGGDPAALLPWFELCERRQDERRQEALQKEALLVERQDLVAEIASLKEEVNSDAREQERERLLADARDQAEAARAEHALQLGALQQREADLTEAHQRQASRLSRRLEYTEASWLRTQEELQAADADRSRYADATRVASAALARPAPRRGAAEVAARLHAELRALELSSLGGLGEASGLAAEMRAEAELLEHGPLPPLPPAAARAVGTQKVLASWLTASAQPRGAANAARGGRRHRSP